MTQLEHTKSEGGASGVHLSKADLLQAAADALDVVRSVEVSRHLAYCTSCRGRFEMVRQEFNVAKRYCDEARTLFEGYLHETLSQDDRIRMEAHFLACPNCWVSYDEYVEAHEVAPIKEMAQGLGALGCSAIREKLEAYLNRQLGSDDTHSLWTLHLVNCPDCWDRYCDLVDAREDRIHAADSGKLARQRQTVLTLAPIVRFPLLMPKMEGRPQRLAADSAGSPVDQAVDAQEFPGEGFTVFMARDEHDHVVAQMQSDRYHISGVLIELVEETEGGVRVQKGTETDASGVADFGALLEIGPPQTNPYRLRVGRLRAKQEKEKQPMKQEEWAALLEREPGLKELEEKGLIRRPLRKKEPIAVPLSLPGKPLSAYLDEGRG